MPASDNYDAILFDVGGTLLNVVRDPQHLVVEAIAHLGTVSVTAYAAGLRQAVQEWRAAGGPAQDEDLPETWVNHNRRALALAGFSGDITSAAQLMEDTFLTDGWEVFADVREVLAAIRNRGFKMGIVSNWPATLEVTLERAALREHFAVVVASANVGYAKPHPQIFLNAAEQLGVAPKRALYVGDSVEQDVIGGNAAGMDVVLLDRLGTSDSTARRISSLSELPGLLDRGS
jgi:HAD superfamily hydrolase (TIGR01509 family)